MTDHIVIIKHPETKNIRRSFTIGSKRHGGTLGEVFYGPGPGYYLFEPNKNQLLESGELIEIGQFLKSRECNLDDFSKSHVLPGNKQFLEKLEEEKKETGRRAKEMGKMAGRIFKRIERDSAEELMKLSKGKK